MRTHPPRDKSAPRPHIDRMSDSLRLASYNIRKAVGLDRRREPSRILDVIAGLEADVVALQEADRRLGARPGVLDPAEIEARTGLVPLAVAANDVSLGWHGNALLVRPGVTLRGLTRLALPSLEPRGAVLAELDGPAGPLRVLGVHLALTRAWRRRQIEAILAALAPLPDRPTVVMGDFNEWSRLGGLAPLTRDFELLSPGRSFHAARPLAALDRFALGGGLSAGDAGVRQDRLASMASDHLPIWTDVELPSRA